MHTASNSIRVMGSLRVVLAAALIATAAAAGVNTAGAQDSERASTSRRGAIDPGMSRAQVIGRFGAPTGERTRGSVTYLYFANGCERRCGMSDLVILERDAVVDAVLRAPGRSFSGASSSPSQVAPSASAANRATRPASTGASSGGVVVAGPAVADSAPRRPRAATRPRRRAAAASAAGDTVAPAPRVMQRMAPAGDANRGVAGSDSGTASAATGNLTGRSSTTGPVDASARVNNAGAPLYPSATPVSAGTPRADSAAAPGGSGRAPFQGARPSSADSARAANQRPPADSARRP